MVVVKDANGCESPFNVFNNLFIAEKCPIRENGITLSYTCDPFRTFLGLINVSGGTPPYLYSLDGVTYQTGSHWNNGVPAGLYTIWVKDATGLILLFTVAVTEKCSPVIVVTTSVQPANCGINGVITVNATNGVPPYTYSIDGINFQSSNQFTGLTPANYTIKVKDATSSISSIFVIVGTSCLTVNATTTSSTCGNNNGSITVQASNGTAPYLYSMDGINYVTTNNFTNLGAGSYTVYIKDATGGTGSAGAVITDIAAPVITSVTATPTECINHTGTITINSQGGTTPVLYSIDGILFTGNPAFTNLAAGNYNPKLKDANGCIATAAATVIVNNNITADAGNDVSVCEGKTVVLSGTSNAAQVIWTPATGLSDPSLLQPNASPPVSTMYYLIATSGDCNKKDSVTVMVNPAPVANAGQGSTICFGQNAVLHGNGGSSCLWQPATYLSDAASCDPQVIKPLSSITYKLIVTDAKGCTSLGNSVATIDVTPPPKIFAGNDTSIAVNESLQLNAIDINNSGFSSYSWFPAIALSNPAIQSPVATPKTNTTYIVTAQTPAGCEGRDTINIKVFKEPGIFVANAFTPNGDGRNDVLKAIPVGIKTFKHFSIYDRFGTKVFSTSDPNIGWDGKTKKAVQQYRRLSMDRGWR